MKSITGFALMPNCQNEGLCSFITVPHHIAVTAELNWPFSVLWVHPLNGPAKFRMLTPRFDPITDSFNRPFCGITILLCQKTVQALNIL